jgi:hypothetical protein
MMKEMETEFLETTTSVACFNENVLEFNRFNLTGDTVQEIPQGNNLSILNITFSMRRKEFKGVDKKTSLCLQVIGVCVLGYPIWCGLINFADYYPIDTEMFSSILLKTGSLEKTKTLMIIATTIFFTGEDP